MASITVQPPVLDLSFYAGDGMAFRITCQDADGQAVPITGAVEAQVRVDRITQAAPVVEFSSDLTDAASGIISLSLTGDQTRQLIDDPSSRNGKFSGVWDVQWVAPSAEPRTLCQGKVECLADVTR